MACLAASDADVRVHIYEDIDWSTAIRDRDSIRERSGNGSGKINTVRDRLSMIGVLALGSHSLFIRHKNDRLSHI